MPAVDERPISEFPIALQLLNTALVLVSNPDGLGSYDSNHATLAEIGRIILETQYTQDLGNVDVFNAIKNCRVLSGTATPASNVGQNSQIYIKYQTASNTDTVVGMYFKKDGAWLEIASGGGGGAPVLYGTTDPAAAQGTDGQLYAKYENIPAVSVSVSIYKPTDARTVQITVTEGGSTVYTASPSCDIMGAYNEVESQITLSSGTYTIKHHGEQKNEANVESQFVEINGNEIGFIADGANSSYSINETQTLAVIEGGDQITDMWLKISTDWCPVKIGAEIDDTTPSQNTVYSSDKVEDLLGDKQDATDNTLATTDKTVVGAINELNSGKANLSLLDNMKFKYVVIEAGSTADSPVYSDICIALIGRGAHGLFIGSNSDYQIIDASTGLSCFKITSQTHSIRISNNTQMTCVCCFIYR